MILLILDYISSRLHFILITFQLEEGPQRLNLLVVNTSQYNFIQYMLDFKTKRTVVFHAQWLINSSVIIKTCFVLARIPLYCLPGWCKLGISGPAHRL